MQPSLLVEGAGFEPAKLSRQIYSLIPLAAWVPLHTARGIFRPPTRQCGPLLCEALRPTLQTSLLLERAGFEPSHHSHQIHSLIPLPPWVPLHKEHGIFRPPAPDVNTSSLLGCHRAPEGGKYRAL